MNTVSLFVKLREDELKMNELVEQEISDKRKSSWHEKLFYKELK